MRTSIYTFLLLTALLLTPCEVWAGTDDSGLQVFTVDFSKQLGEAADVAQEDTLLSPYCYNMFSSGNGMTTLPEPIGSGYTWTTGSNSSADCGDSNLGLVVRQDGWPYAKIYLIKSPDFEPPIGTSFLMDENSYTSANSDLFCYQYGSTDAVFVGNKIIAIGYSSTAPVILKTATGRLDLSTCWCRSAAIWQNRLFLAHQSYIFYSAAQDFENFSNTATAGGTTLLYDSAQIYKLVGTRYGLYIFTNKGIYIQTGTGAKNSWSIEKISDVVLYNRKCVATFNDVIYFAGQRLHGSVIYSISGVSVSPFIELPNELSAYQLSSDMTFIQGGKYLLLSSSYTGGTGYIVDVARKTMYRSGEYNGLGSRWHFLKKTATGYKIYRLPTLVRFNNEYSGYGLNYIKSLYPWEYRTNWLTLDGNSGNRKEIDRIEFDYQGGTTSVYLYYAYGNGSSAYATTTLTAPVNTRLSTYTWNAPIGKQQSNRFYLYFLSNGTQTMTTNYILKQARIYYRNIGNYKTNSLR